MSLCLDCGDEVDDFSPCGCTTYNLTHRPPRTTPLTEKEKLSRTIAAGGMRAMVAKRLARQRAQQGKV